MTKYAKIDPEVYNTLIKLDFNISPWFVSSIEMVLMNLDLT